MEGEDVNTHRQARPRPRLPFSDIASAKLLLTDRLINATAPLSTDGADTIQTVEE